ncbi:MAG: AbrB/MazE/SpoVT family DNA-binding domain-containing protein [Aphanocapsa lilacina HA4352-LM1]|uniref:Cell growth regulatory protein n=1 Tax=Gloeobacter violaceus (strain ATCC 29082 / PCC 7421) TaxID=251221 RepID=Q7NPG0_GLOVI|nr:AbrB/MazE/SpoVT family DNA-binding domain-containing protein [Gloeobacter violaceus]MBW4699576.1 AbrB/MazE/SpoVT family DNA-binding domain-containing protein [Aphanocapsa lilacina HA4352-LM1]BAC88036.1 cell growth regulatory protein [Gloeobacter violaceus PCC 7421]
MKSQVARWGNSLAFRIPRQIVIQLGLKPHTTLLCSVEAGALVVRPVREVKEYSLEELLVGPLEVEDEVDWGKPEGKEAW